VSAAGLTSTDMTAPSDFSQWAGTGTLSGLSGTGTLTSPRNLYNAGETLGAGGWDGTRGRQEFPFEAEQKPTDGGGDGTAGEGQGEGPGPRVRAILSEAALQAWPVRTVDRRSVCWTSPGMKPGWQAG
jgi:hypothetical protein